MNLRPTIAAVVLAVIGVAVAVALYRTGPAGDGVTLIPLPGASTIPADAVNRITVRRAGAPAMVLEHNAGGWMQVEPFAFPMDAFSVRRLIVDATAVEVVRVLEPGEVAAAGIGLDPPRAELTLAWPDGSYTLSFGRRSVAGRSYLRPAGDARVFVVTGELYERAVEMNPKEWRDRTIFAPAPADLAAIEIADGDRRVVLEQQRKRWTMTEPARTRVDADAADALVSAIQRAKSGGFILDNPDDLSRFGLATPSGVVTVRSQRQVVQGNTVVTVADETRLLIGSRTGVGSEDRFGIVEGRPAVVQIPEAVIAAFFPKAVSLVDPTPSGVEPADVKSVVIRRGDGELRLQRDLDRWTAPDLDADADPAVVDSLLAMLATTRAADVEIVDMPLYTAAGRTITVYGFDGLPLETIRFGVTLPSQPAGFPMDNGDNVWRILPAETVIPLTPADFGIGVGESARASDSAAAP